LSSIKLRLQAGVSGQILKIPFKIFAQNFDGVITTIFNHNNSLSSMKHNHTAYVEQNYAQKYRKPLKRQQKIHKYACRKPYNNIAPPPAPSTHTNHPLRCFQYQYIKSGMVW